MTTALTEISWPASRLGEALAALGRHGRLGARQGEDEPPPAALAVEGDDRLGRWIEAAAAWLGFEAEPVAAPYPEVETLVRGAAPALLRLPPTPTGVRRGRGSSPLWGAGGAR